MTDALLESMEEKDRRLVCALYYWRKRMLEQYFSAWKGVIFALQKRTDREFKTLVRRADRNPPPRTAGELKTTPRTRRQSHHDAESRWTTEVSAQPTRARRWTLDTSRSPVQRSQPAAADDRASVNREDHERRVKNLKQQYRELKRASGGSLSGAVPSLSPGHPPSDDHLIRAALESRRDFRESLHLVFRAFAQWKTVVDEITDERSRIAEVVAVVWLKRVSRTLFQSWKSFVLHQRYKHAILQQAEISHRERVTRKRLQLWSLRTKLHLKLRFAQADQWRRAKSLCHIVRCWRQNASLRRCLHHFHVRSRQRSSRRYFDRWRRSSNRAADVQRRHDALAEVHSIRKLQASFRSWMRAYTVKMWMSSQRLKRNMLATQHHFEAWHSLATHRARLRLQIEMFRAASSLRRVRTRFVAWFSLSIRKRCYRRLVRLFQKKKARRSVRIALKNLILFSKSSVLLRRHCERRLRAAVSAWNKITHEQRQSRVMLARASTIDSARRLHTAMRLWSIYAIRSQWKREAVAKALNCKFSVLQKKCLHAWYIAVRRRLRVHAMLAFKQRIHDSMMARQLFCEWRRLTRVRRLRKTRHLQALTFASMKRLMQHFCAWFVLYEHQKQKRQNLKNATLQHQKRSCSHAVTRWHRYARALRRRNRRRELAARHRNYKLLQRVARAWQVFAQQQVKRTRRSVQAAAFYFEYLQYSAFFHWQNATLRRCMTREKQRLATERMQSAKLARAVACWRHQAGARTRKIASDALAAKSLRLNHIATEFVNRSRNEKYWTVWTRWFTAHREAKWKAELAIGYWNRCLTRKSFEQWVANVERRKRKQLASAVAAEHAATKLLRFALKALSQAARSSTKRKQRQVAAAAQLESLRQSRSVNKLLQHRQRKKRGRMQRQEATLYFEQTHQRQHWTALVNQWFKKIKTMKHKLAAAAIHSNRRILRVCFRGMMRYSCQMAHLRVRVSRFRVRYFRSMTEECFCRWKRVSYIRSMLRKLERSKRRAAQERVLHTWRRVTTEHVRQRRKLSALVCQRWRTYTLRSKQARLAVGVANVHITTKLLRFAFNALTRAYRVSKEQQRRRKSASVGLDLLRQSRAVNKLLRHCSSKKRERWRRTRAVRRFEESLQRRHWKALISEWLAGVRVEKQQQATARKYSDSRILRACFSGVNRYCHQMKRLRVRVSRFRLRYFRSVTDECFFRWKRIARIRANLRELAQSHKRSMQDRILQAWYYAAKESKRRYNVLVKYADRRQRRTLASCFVHWESVATDRWIHDRLVETATSQRRVAFKSKAFARWRRLLMVRRARESWKQRALQRQRGWLCTIVRHWRSMCTRQRQIAH